MGSFAHMTLDIFSALLVAKQEVVKLNMVQWIT